MSGARILIVDDEPEVRRALRTSLSGIGFDVETAETGEEALQAVHRHVPDLILLDLQLPDMTGIEVCREIRTTSDVPIIVISAQGAESAKVEALDEGADDYLTKPFGVAELRARIRASLRRSGATRIVGGAKITRGALSIDIERRIVTVRGEPVHLRPKEYEMLRYLASNAGKLVTHRMLLRAVWGAEYEDARPYLHVHVGQLRRKIEPDPSNPVYILTEPGVGYRFAEMGAEESVPDEGPPRT